MNIYVSNLSFAVQDEDLREFFTEYGEVSSAKIITDKLTNRSRGFGFVRFVQENDAQAAIDAMNNVEYEFWLLLFALSHKSFAD